MRSLSSKARSAVTLAALFTCSMGFAQAQPTPSGSSATGQSASAAQPLTKAEQKKQTKAQRKEERKVARAKNAAELKKLESSGYQPGADNPHYPQDLQNAEKKASRASGASQ